MAIAAGTHQLGPDKGSLEIRTYREGMASKAGHDLIIDVTRWEGTLTVAQDGGPSTLELSADPRSLEIREGVGGLKPLSDKDRAEIRKNIDEKALGGETITFRSRRLGLTDDGSRLTAEGDLSMAGNTRAITADLDVEAGGRVTGTIPLTQSEWGIKPYRGLMGALKVRDSLEVVVDVKPA
jgi:polyisoprenoid-binding protein YceI